MENVLLGAVGQKQTLGQTVLAGEMLENSETHRPVCLSLNQTLQDVSKEPYFREV